MATASIHWGGAATFLERRHFPDFLPISEASGSVDAPLLLAAPRHPALASLPLSGFQRAPLRISSPVQCSGLHPNCSLCWAALGLLGRTALSTERPPPTHAVASFFLSHALGCRRLQAARVGICGGPGIFCLCLCIMNYARSALLRCLRAFLVSGPARPGKASGFLPCPSPE